MENKLLPKQANSDELIKMAGKEVLQNNRCW